MDTNNDSILIRQARPEEYRILTELAVRSEAHWGYDSEYMATFRAEYGVTEKYIEINPVFVLEKDGRPVGFYGFLLSEPSLEYLFIDPECIGKGFGRLLWQHALSVGKAAGLTSFFIVTSPQVKNFYLKMGAEFLGETESLVRKGRMIPRFQYSYL